MGSFKYFILFLLFAISLVSSLVLAFPPESFYNFEGCEVVLNSEQTNFSNFGYFGIVIFSLGALFSLLSVKKIRRSNRFFISLLIIVGAIFSGYLVYNQYIVYSNSCFYVNVLGSACLVSLLILFFSRRRYSRVRRRR